MTNFIILLRGVMPTGKNKVPMARLREILTDAGYGNVRTYIQSGNVLLDTRQPALTVEESVHALIREHIGPDLVVVARTREELKRVLEENPFTEGLDISRVFFTLFARQPLSKNVAALLAEDFGAERLVISDSAAYMYIPGTYGRGKLSGNFLEKKLGVPATMRNFNTLSRLVELSSAG